MITTTPTDSIELLPQFDEHAQSIAKRQYMQPGDGDVLGMFRRVATWVSSSEPTEARTRWTETFFTLMSSKRFCPGGRVLAGAGTQHGNVLNCFVQGATEHAPASFEGIMEVAKKLALVTKVGGGNGVNLDVYPPRQRTNRTDTGVRGWAYMNVNHPDVEDFIRGFMRPPTQPDGNKQITAVRHWTKVIYGNIPQKLTSLARQHGVLLADTLPEGVETIPDDMGGIIDAAAEVVRRVKMGLEPRINLSSMRPEGAEIKGSGGTSSGPVSFLFEIFDNFLEWANLGAEQSGPVATLRYCYAPVLRVVRQGGTRRGAGMATIAIDHPDILDFLTAKDLDRETAEGDISTFNISILVSERFWNKIQADSLCDEPLLEVPGKYRVRSIDEPYAGQRSDPISDPKTLEDVQNIPLYPNGVPARWLWHQIALHAWATGEPGLIFIDRVNAFSALQNLGPRYEIRSTNPCGEIPLTVGEPCDLGAINLAAYVQNNRFDFEEFKRDVAFCIRFLDNVLEVNRFALEDNREASQNLRRLGLGVMGLADCLIKLGLRYDREDGRTLIEEIMTTLRIAAIQASEVLADERGVYPIYAKHAKDIPHAPRRNVAVLTVAPTGTTSMLMGVSSGIEPVFSPFVWRKIGAEYKALIAPLFQELLEQFPPTPDLERHGRWDWDKVTEQIGANHGSLQGLKWVPKAVSDVFVCAHDIAPLDHVRMQGVVQRAFDADGFAANSLSKTINLPNSATIEDVEAAYTEAYHTGCKGITVYRDGSRQFQVLSTSKTEDGEENTGHSSTGAEPATGQRREPQIPSFQPGRPLHKRPARLTGVTDMVKLTDLTAGTKRTFLITVNTLETNPIEVVVVSGRAGDEANADSEALGRVVSIALQYGVPSEAIQKTLRGINGGLYGSYNGRLVASKADLIAVALESTAHDGNARSDLPSTAPLAAAAEHRTFAGLGEACPSCHSDNLIREEGCLKCLACGYSKCG